MDVTAVLLAIITGTVTIATVAIQQYFNSKRKKDVYEHNNLVRERTLDNAVNLLVGTSGEKLSPEDYKIVRDYLRKVDSNKVFAKHDDETLNLMIRRKVLSIKSYDAR